MPPSGYSQRIPQFATVLTCAESPKRTSIRHAMKATIQPSEVNQRSSELPLQRESHIIAISTIATVQIGPPFMTHIFKEPNIPTKTPMTSIVTSLVCSGGLRLDSTTQAPSLHSNICSQGEPVGYHDPQNTQIDEYVLLIDDVYWD